MLRIVMLLAVALSFAGLARADIPPPYEPYGIGIVLDEAEPFPTIATIGAGSPAELAGLKVGDGVIAINGNFTKAVVPFYLLARILQGPQNSKVELVILRDRGKVLVREVTRSLRTR